MEGSVSMRCVNGFMACTLVVQLSLVTQVSSAQIISRFKDRKTTGKDQETTPRVFQPPISSTSQGNSGSGTGEAAAGAERNRLKPIPLSVTPPTATRVTLQVAESVTKSDKVNVRTTFPLVSIDTAGPAEVNLGQRAKYTVTVRNDGDAPANGLVLQATLPAGAELTEAVPHPDASEDSCLEFRLGDLAPKAVAKLQIELIPRQRGSVDLKTHASISTSAIATIQVRPPEVAIDFSGPSDAIVGDTVKFKATITNTGDVLVENLSIAQLPSPREDGEVTMTEAVLQPLQSRIERLRPGQSQQVEVLAVAMSAGLMRGNIMVKGADGLEAQDAAEVRVRQPALAIKTIGPESRVVQRSGGYVILVSNTGDAAAEGVVVTISVPKGLELVGIEKRSTF